MPRRKLRLKLRDVSTRLVFKQRSSTSQDTHNQPRVSQCGLGHSLLGKEAVMYKMFLDGFGMVLIILGIISASGAAGDCDGNCMENANSISFMLIILLGSLCACILGGIMIRLARFIEDN